MLILKLPVFENQIKIEIGTGESPSFVCPGPSGHFNSSFIWTFQDQALEGTQDEKWRHLAEEQLLA